MSVRRERFRGNVTVQYLDPTAVPRDDIVFGPITLNKTSETEMGAFNAGPSTFYVTSFKINFVPALIEGFEVALVILTLYIDNITPGLVLSPSQYRSMPEYLSLVSMKLEFQPGQQIVVKGKLMDQSTHATRDATVTIKGSYTNPIV